MTKKQLTSAQDTPAVEQNAPVQLVSAPQPPPTSPVAQTAPAVVSAPSPDRMSDTDKLSLELAKQSLLLAQSENKSAQLNYEKAELAYKYMVLQVYFKYGLTNDDAIAENGSFVRGGAKQGQQ